MGDYIGNMKGDTRSLDYSLKRGPMSPRSIIHSSVHEGPHC